MAFFFSKKFEKEKKLLTCYHPKRRTTLAQQHLRICGKTYDQTTFHANGGIRYSQSPQLKSVAKPLFTITDSIEK